MTHAPDIQTHPLPSPGTYLRLRREAARLSIEDVVAIVGTVPAVPLPRRAALLEAIEADLTPIDQAVIVALRTAMPLGSFRFDPLVLIRLIDLRAGSPLQQMPPRLCRVCACSEFDPCYRRGLHGHTVTCGWAASDLCDACEKSAGRRAAAGPDEGDSGEDLPSPANVPVNDVVASPARSGGDA